MITSEKGMFFYGHEQEDVVQETRKFLAKMVEVGFLHLSKAQTPKAALAFPPVPLYHHQMFMRRVFHGQSTFQANEDQTNMWGKKGEHILRPKARE